MNQTETLTAQNASQFREKIRQLEKKLGMLSQHHCGSCEPVTLSQCHALVEIGRNDSLSLKQLSEILLLDASTTSRVVDQLVKKGYVLRTSSKTDRRGIEITLTNQGNEYYTSIESEMNQLFLNRFKKIPAESREIVMESIELLIAAFS
ncbi:MAG: MarR family transcriptional regulator [Lachnospiraceae bacterium]|nr:MarR family transcriptional regulator [Lachnospiraceae bacterium]